jgi:hypothetical protein
MMSEISFADAFDAGTANSPLIVQGIIVHPMNALCWNPFLRVEGCG